MPRKKGSTPRRRKSAKPAAPSRAPRTAWQRKRDDALAAQGYTKRDVWRQACANGVDVSVQTVQSVLDGRFRNLDVERAFCQLTALAPGDAFPLDEPPFGRRDGAKTRLTSAKRAAAMAAQNGNGR